MERVNRILQQEIYKQHIKKNEEAEADRRFCRHNMGHFLDVARIAMILNEQEKLDIPKELIYAAALLHDIGRHVQYRDGTLHEKAGAELAPAILEACGFAPWEQEMIVRAIAMHRTEEAAGEPSLSGILYRADKLSRPCFACEAEMDCHWKNHKKNLEITI